MKYTKTHEWIKALENDEAIVGISDHAQKELSDIVHVEFPEIGKTFNQGDILLTVESVKAASDIYAPLGGEVIEINQDLKDSPEKVNSSPEKEGWLIKIKIKNSEELGGLLATEDYQKEINS